jgi:hypothetical protein
VTIVQADGLPACVTTLSPASTTVAADGGQGTVAVSTAPGCNWTASSAVEWIAVTSGGRGNGNGQVGFRVSPNTTTASRQGTLAIGGSAFAIAQASRSCSYAISPGGQTVPAAGGTASIAVTASDGCAWTAASDVPWIAVSSGASGHGNGMVTVAVSGNNGAARTGTVSVAGQTFTVTQSAPSCNYAISPTSHAAGSDGGATSVSVTTGGNCSWTAAANAPWLSVTSGASGTGNGTVSITIAANTGGARTGAVTIAGQTFSVSQAAPTCTYSITPTTQALAAASGGGSVSVAAGGTCAWTAVSNVSWLSVTGGASGTGNGTVTFTAADNTGAPRTGTMTIAGQTFAVSQAGASCTFALAPSGQTVPSGGGTGTATLTVSGTCSWTAVSNAPWISITSGGTGAGSGTVAFSAAANTGDARTGTLTVAGQTFTVMQEAAPCSYTITPSSQAFTAATGSGSVAVGAGTTCSWMAVSNADWITITSGASGTGAGAVSYSVAENTGPMRSGTLTVAGQTFTVMQSAP